MKILESYSKGLLTFTLETYAEMAKNNAGCKIVPFYCTIINELRCCLSETSVILALRDNPTSVEVRKIPMSYLFQ